MNFKSYTGKVFTVISNDARIRQANDLSKFVKYAVGDELPPGAKAGDARIIPKRTEVFITDAKTDAAKNVYVLAEPREANGTSYGWTRATNLEGDFMNEIIGLMPVKWDLVPCGDNFTVTDKRAVLRSGAPRFASLSTLIPFGTYVVVVEKSKDNRYVRVCRGRVENGGITAEEEIGWTSVANLTDGCTNVFASDAWSDQHGANACWEGGRCTGQKILINIVGTGGEVEQLTLDLLEVYLKLRDAAANDNITLGVESGFRTYEKQRELYDGYKARKPGFNLAAAPGRSNHQNGRAVDLNTRGFDGTPVYDWLKRKAPRWGFIRTVNGEHWHWEYRPAEAEALAREGKFATKNVRK